MGIPTQLNDATSLLSAMGPVEAARLVSDDRDLHAFLRDHGFELTEEEILELKARFRG